MALPLWLSVAAILLSCLGRSEAQSDSRDFYIIVGVACSGAIAIAAALILAVLVVWIIKWRTELRLRLNRTADLETAAVVPIPSPKEKPPVTTTMADYADVRDCVSFSCTPAQNGEPSTPTLTVTDTVGYGEILHSAPKLQRVRNSSNANKLVDDSRHQSRAFSVTAMRDAIPQKQSTAMASTTPDISTCPEVPPPIPPRGLNMDQDSEAGDSSLPCGQAADGTPQADSMDANGCLATETTAEAAQ